MRVKAISLKLVLMESGMGVGVPHVSERPEFVLLKVAVATEVPSTIMKIVLLGHESILYTFAVRVRE